MVEATGALIVEYFAALDDPGSTAPSGTNSWISSPLPFVAPSAAPITGWISSSSATAKRSGSSPSWSCPTVFPPMIPSETSSPGWIRSSSNIVSLSGFKPWPSSPKAKWWPSTARRCAAPMTAPWAKGPSTWSTCGPRPMAWRWARPRWKKSPMRSPPYPSCCTCWISPDAFVTIDAMGCQKEIAREIVEVQADYLLAVKKNQGQLYEDVRDLFEGAQEFDFEGVPYDFARTVSKNHGPPRNPSMLGHHGPRLSGLHPDPATVGQAQRRGEGHGPKGDGYGTSVQSRYYISSLASQAKTLLEPPAAIGVSKTACTGPWTLPFEKITVVSARIMVPKTWRSYARLPSIC